MSTPPIIGVHNVIHCTDDVDEESFWAPACPNGCVDHSFFVNLDLEGVQITFNPIANFIVNWDIWGWRFLGVASLDLLLPQALGDYLLIGHGLKCFQ